MHKLEAILASTFILVISGCVEPANPVTNASRDSNVAEQKAITPQPTPTSQAGTPQGKVTAINLSTFYDLMQSDSLLIYDVRPSIVHGLGSIPGSISWPKNAYEKQAPERESEIRNARSAGKNVVIYCTDAACPDAEIVARKIAMRGHDVSVLEGGYAIWKEAGLNE